MAGKTYKTKTYDTKKIKDKLKKIGTGMKYSPAAMVELIDLADFGIKLTMQKGGSPKSTKGKSTMYKKKMASGKTVKGGKTDFDKMVKELGLSKSEIADMLGLTKRDPKTGVRRKAGGTVSRKAGKRVGCGAALRGYGKAMTKKG